MSGALYSGPMHMHFIAYVAMMFQLAYGRELRAHSTDFFFITEMLCTFYDWLAPHTHTHTHL